MRHEPRILPEALRRAIRASQSAARVDADKLKRANSNSSGKGTSLPADESPVGPLAGSPVTR